MTNWSEVDATIRAHWPQMRQNLLDLDALNKAMQEKGIPTPPMPWYLREAIRTAKERK